MQTGISVLGNQILLLGTYYLGIQAHPSTLLHLIVPLKSVSGFQNLPSVSVVNDHADTVSA